MKMAIRLFLTLIGALLIFNAITFAQGVTINGFEVSYGSRAYNSTADRTTFTYSVAGTGVPPDLSHLDVEIPICEETLDVISFAPTEAVEFGTDPTTGVNGIKWDIPLDMNGSRAYSITFDGFVAEGEVSVAVKGGNGFEIGTLPGPACQEASIALEKFVSVDGGETWENADIPTGPIAEVGGEILFTIAVLNDGDYPLTNINLTDSVFNTDSCPVPDALDPDVSFECVLGPFEAEEGQHVNVATVTAFYDDQVVSAGDRAHYFAGTLPQISIEKFVSIAGDGMWNTADNAPGLQIPEDHEVAFRIVVTNDGTEDLTGISLSDSMVDISSCDVPDALPVGETIECEFGPFEVEIGEFSNTATVAASFDGETLTATDSAHYFVEERDEDVTIVIIEGPIEIIIDNIIIIWGREIVLDPDDPIIQVIQVGDIIRIEGEIDLDGDVIIIIPIIVVIIDIDIFINGDDDDVVIWRDGECANPPPPWAPAHGWRRKCQGTVVDIEISKKSRGRGRSK